MSAPNIVLAHGLWMPGAEMLFVKQRLERGGRFRCHLFAYPSARRFLDDNARAFADFAASVGPVDGVVGHSLGGIVALRALALHGPLGIRRIVCLGSPLLGCRAAAALHANPLGRRFMGPSLPTASVGATVADWSDAVTAAHEVGVIAGTHSAGLGRVFAGFDEPNDGTVAVSETRLPGIADHIILPVSHTGMVISATVARQAANFLDTGAFSRSS